MESEDLKVPYFQELSSVIPVEELPRVYNFADWLYFMDLEPDNQYIITQFKTLIRYLDEYVVLPNRIPWVKGVLDIISDHKCELARGLKEWSETRLKTPKVTFEEYEHEMSIIADAAWCMCQDMVAELVAQGMSPEEAKKCGQKYSLAFLQGKIRI